MPAALSRGKIDKLISDLERQGTRVEWQGKNVRKLYFPNGDWAQVHNSPSDINWTYNVRRRVVKAGLVWPLEDSKATKRAAKAHSSAKPPIPDNWERPVPPFEHVLVPPGVGFYKAFKGVRGSNTRPTDKQIGYVRGALFKIGNPETFWTASVTDELADVVGMKAAGNEIRGTLDWLGYQVVEARKYKVGHLYRWMLDPTKDRAAQETLPMIVPGGNDAVEPEEPEAEPETPAKEPEPASEAQEPAQEPSESGPEMVERHARAYRHFEAEVERLTGIAEQHRRTEVDLRQQRDEFRAEAVQLRARLAAAEEERDRLRERSPQQDGWPAIDFKGDATWAEIQEWATSFGLDVSIVLRRAE